MKHLSETHAIRPTPEMLDGVWRGAAEGGRSRRVGTEAKLHHLGRQRLRGGGVAWVHGKHEAPRLHKDRPQTPLLQSERLPNQKDYSESSDSVRK